MSRAPIMPGIPAPRRTRPDEPMRVESRRSERAGSRARKPRRRSIGGTGSRGACVVVEDFRRSPIIGPPFAIRWPEFGRVEIAAELSHV